jgi:hypothetical protein
MHYVRALLAAGVLAASAGGCGSGGGTTSAGAAARVVSGTCSASSTGSAGSRVTKSCVLVLSDGQRFRCRSAFAGSTPSARVLEHTRGCVRMPSLVISPGVRAVIAAIAKARTCLTTKGLRAIGGPVLPPNPPGSSSADGELVVGNAARGAFIAFYTDAGRAWRLEAGVARNASRISGRVERHGAVTVVWVRSPAGELRKAVETCALG